MTDDSELEAIRRKKMAQLIAREKKLQQEREKRKKVQMEREKILARFLAPDAAAYLSVVRKQNPTIAKRIEDVFLYLIVYRGIRQQFSQLDVRYVERQIKGEEPRIRVQRDGELSEFSQYVREALKDE